MLVFLTPDKWDGLGGNVRMLPAPPRPYMMYGSDLGLVDEGMMRDVCFCISMSTSYGFSK